MINIFKTNETYSNTPNTDLFPQKRSIKSPAARSARSLQSYGEQCQQPVELESIGKYISGVHVDILLIFIQIM